MTDSTTLSGNIIYPINNQLIWLNSPKYQPYTDSSIYSISAKNIQSFHIQQQGRHGYHALQGALGGIFLYNGFIYTFYEDLVYLEGSSGLDVESIHLAFSAVCGMAVGLLQSAIRKKDLKGSLNGYYFFNRKEFKKLRAGSLHPMNRVKLFRKRWIENDSIIKDHPLPPLSATLQPRHKGIKLQISFASGHTNLFRFIRRFSKNPRIEVPVTIKGGQKRYFTKAYTEGRPNFLEIRILYQLNPWLKVGAQAIGTETTRDLTGVMNSYIESFGPVEMNHAISWGLITEYTPFPVKYLRLRKWELSLGGGIFLERATFFHNQSFTNAYQSPIEIQPFQTNHEDRFVKPALLGYGSLTYFPLPFLSFQSRLGHYWVGKGTSSGFTVEFDTPIPDIYFEPPDN